MGLDGNLEDFPLADVLQLINMGARTGLLTINHNSQQAHIWFDRGQAVHALIGDLDGEKAVYETFNWKEGRFNFDTDARAATQSITLDCQNLIMEAVRRLDEWTKLRKIVPASNHVVAFAAGPSDKADNIILQAHEWKVLSLVNGELDVATLAARTGFSEFQTTQIVFTLVEAGLLIVYPPSDRVAPPPETPQDTARVKSLREFLAGVESPPKKVGTSGENTPLGARTNVGILAFFINILLDNFDKPNGLYNAIKQEKTLHERVAEQQERYPQVVIIKFSAANRIDVSQLDGDIETLDDLGKKNLIVALAEVKEQIYGAAEKQSNKIAASRRYNKVLEGLFGNRSSADMGLGSILEKKAA